MRCSYVLPMLIRCMNYQLCVEKQIDRFKAEQIQPPVPNNDQYERKNFLCRAAAVRGSDEIMDVSLLECILIR